MIELALQDLNEPAVLCLGAHCDDIEIGCGGMLLEFGRSLKNASLHCVVFASNDIREAETRAALTELGESWASVRIDVHRFRNGYFPYVGADIKDAFEALKPLVQPDIIFTHYSGDRHQDHRVVSDLTWNTFRNHWILEYEIPKFDGDLGQPNVYVEISETFAEKKVDCLQRCFESQHDKQWFRRETFMALMRLRSIECNTDSGFAEAYYVHKAMLRA